MKPAQTNPIFKICSGGKNHFLQNKPNFQNWQNVLTPFPVAGCRKLAAGCLAKNKPKQSQFQNGRLETRDWKP
jgi:hypothetical protein